MKKIIVTGHVGHNPSTRDDKSGGEFTTFSLGVTVGTKQNPKTDWVNVSCSGKLSDTAKNYIVKGMKVLVEGFPTATAYLTREKQPAATLQVYANNIEFLSSKDDKIENDSPARTESTPAQQAASPNMDSDIPFN